MIFVGQRSQRLSEQAGFVHIDVKVALATPMERPSSRHNVAQIPGLECLQGFFVQSLAVDVELNAVSTVLNQQKCPAIADKAAGYRELMVVLL